VLIRTVDTGVVVIAVANFLQIGLAELWVSFGTAKNYRCIEVCLDSLLTSSSASNLLSTLRLSEFSEFEGQNTLPKRSSAFTGCASQNVGYLLQTSTYDVWIHPRHFSVLPTSVFHPCFRHPDDGCGLLPHIV